MSEDRFFRWATAAPLVIPAIAGLATALLEPIESLPGVFTVRGVAGTIGVAGLYSAIPYLLFLIILYTFVRPATIEAWHRALAIAPLAIAAVCAAASTVYNVVQGTRSPLAGVDFWSSLVLITGYAYAGAIWLVRALFKRARWIA